MISQFIKKILGWIKQENWHYKVIVVGLWLATVMVTVALISSNYATLREEHFRQADSDAQEALISFDKYSTGLFDYSDSYLRSARRTYLESHDANMLRRALLEIRAPRSQEFSDVLTIANAAGKVVFRSEGDLTKEVNLADLDYFTVLRDSRQDRLIVDATRRGRVTGQMQYRFVRPILKNGIFDGVIVLTLMPEHLSEFFRNMGLGPHSESLMLTTASRLIASYPVPADGGFDRVTPGLRLWDDLEARPEGRIRRESPVDGVTRTYVYKRLADYPVVVAAGVADQDVFDTLAGTRTDMILLASSLSVSALVVALLVLRLLGHLARHRADEAALLRLSRLLATQSAGNQAVVRATDQTSLFQSICDIVVNSGGFRMAWIGVAEKDHEKTVRPVAIAGQHAGYLDDARISWGDNPRGFGISGTAIRTGQAQINTNFVENSQMAPWAEPAAERGYRSSIALPLKNDAGVFGVLTIYSGDVGAFGVDDVKLLRDLAEDVSFGVTALTARQRHREVEHALVHMQKMDALGHLTGGVAHDFNNLLQVILSNLDLAMGVQPPDGVLAGYLGNAVKGAQQGARLTAQLLAFARRQPLNPQPLRCDRLIGEMTAMMRRTIGETIAIELTAGRGLWSALADPSQLQNAILNLAINARDAMPGGGKLVIAIANAVLDEGYAAEHLEIEPGDYVKLEVTDSGTGMSPEVLAQACEPFFTTKADGAGTGLGLSMVYGFVRQSGGHIQIESHLGQGTTVRLYLPRSRQPEVLPTEETKPLPRGKGEIILVAEDDPSVRDAVTAQLSGLGYQVISAVNGEQALQILEGGQRVDLLFTDVVMPGAHDGPALAERARLFEPGLPVLFTSGYPENAGSQPGRLDDGIVLLGKPYRLANLAESVAAALRQRRPPPAPVREARKPGILVVEDEEIVREVMTENLENAEYQVTATGHPGEALRLLEANPGIRILITDYFLPGMNGLSLASQAMALRPGLSVILATGQAIDRSELPDPSIVLLTKPFKLAALFSAIDTLVEPAL